MDTNEITQFLRLIQLTRSQPQYGYVLSGVKKADLSDLAEHHYLVTLTAWLLTRKIKEEGGKINSEKVLEICLLHDLGELMGGDIALPYAKVNPQARTYAKKFEHENQIYLTKLLGNSKHLKELFSEAEIPHSDEGQVAKIADYVEVTHYKDYLGRRTVGDIRLIQPKIIQMTGKIKNVKAKKAVTKFIAEWIDNLSSEANSPDLFEKFK